ITKVEPGVSIDFERFEDYWAGSPKGKPAIKKLAVRFVPDATTEMTELLANRADWIWNLNPDQFENINKLPHIMAVRKESMRVGYLSLDAAGRTGADNPITKLKVRQAIWHAIDRQAMADKLVTGGSRVPAAPCFPTQFGCNGEAATLYDYNPAKAKQLLSEAGYPDGFDLEVASYVLPQWAGAMGYDLWQTKDDQRVVRMFNHFRAGQLDEAMAIYWQIEPIRAASWNLHGRLSSAGLYPFLSFKYQQWLVGGNGGMLRQPIHRLAEWEMVTLRNALVAGGITPHEGSIEEFLVGRAAYNRGERLPRGAAIVKE
ncbi:MAG: hypothetical protein J0H99_25140, partial [Rhodospirillales bacterium]|nr:hypothetical protein [Rhodospirillales bacterium]